MEILLFVLILMSLVAYLLFKLNYKKTKKPTIKKHEIIEQYKNELRNIIYGGVSNEEKNRTLILWCAFSGFFISMG